MVAIAVLCLGVLVAASRYMWSDVEVIAGLCAAPLVYYVFLNAYAHYFVFGPVRDARKHLTIADFHKEFEGSNFDSLAVEIVYQELTHLTEFPIVRSDHLWNTLRLDREDVEDSLEERLKASGIGEVCSTTPIDTVEDYVRFLSYVVGAGSEKALSSARIASSQ